jgi:hypothetical protein
LATAEIEAQAEETAPADERPTPPRSEAKAEGATEPTGEGEATARAAPAEPEVLQPEATTAEDAALVDEPARKDRARSTSRRRRGGTRGRRRVTTAKKSPAEGADPEGPATSQGGGGVKQDAPQKGPPEDKGPAPAVASTPKEPVAVLNTQGTEGSGEHKPTAGDATG